MHHTDQSPLSNYNSLLDKNLSGYFANTRMRKHLVKSGLITRSGHITNENTYRVKMAKKEHRKHVRDLLANAIVEKALDMERMRQHEIRKRLDDLYKIELVQKVRSDRTDSKSKDDLVAILSPRGKKTKSRKAKSAAVTHSERNMTHLPDIHFDDRNKQLYYEHPSSSIMSDDGMTAVKAYHHPTPPSHRKAASAQVRPKPRPPQNQKKPKQKRKVHRGLLLAKSNHIIAHRVQLQSMAEVTMKYLGSSLNLTSDMFPASKLSEVQVIQQHCGGSTICVFRELLPPNTMFTFVSRRHRGSPFGLTINLNGVCNIRVSSCCEYKHKPGYRIGGKSSHFSLVQVQGAAPCYKCQIRLGMLDGEGSIRQKDVSSDEEDAAESFDIIVSRAGKRKENQQERPISAHASTQTAEEAKLKDEEEYYQNDEFEQEEIEQPINLQGLSSEESSDSENEELKDILAPDSEDLESSSSESENESDIENEKKVDKVNNNNNTDIESSSEIEKTTTENEENESETHINLTETDITDNKSDSDTDDEKPKHSDTEKSHSDKSDSEHSDKSDSDNESVSSKSSKGSSKHSDSDTDNASDTEKEVEKNTSDIERNSSDIDKESDTEKENNENVNEKKESDNEIEDKKTIEDGNNKDLDVSSENEEKKENEDSSEVDVKDTEEEEANKEIALVIDSDDDDEERKVDGVPSCISRESTMLTGNEDGRCDSVNKSIVFNEEVDVVHYEKVDAPLSPDTTPRSDSDDSDLESINHISKHIVLASLDDELDDEIALHDALQDQLHDGNDDITNDEKDDDKPKDQSISDEEEKEKAVENEANNEKEAEEVESEEEVDITTDLVNNNEEEILDETTNTNNDKKEDHAGNSSDTEESQPVKWDNENENIKEDMDNQQNDNEQEKKSQQKETALKVSKQKNSDDSSSSSSSDSSQSSDSDSDDEGKKNNSDNKKDDSAIGNIEFDKETSTSETTNINTREDEKVLSETESKYFDNGHDPDMITQQKLNNATDERSLSRQDSTEVRISRPGSVRSFIEDWKDIELHNSILSLEQTDEFISSLVEEVNEIESISLRNTAIEGGIEALKDAIKLAPKLKTLNLNSIQLEADDCMHLADVIVTGHHAIQTLMLHGNPLYDDGITILTKALMKNKTIEILDLGHCEFGDDGAEALFDYLSEANILKELTISNNELSVEGWRYISSALKKNASITVLSVDSNTMGDDACKLLCQGISENQTLISLDIENNDLTNDGGEAIYNAVLNCKSLMDITLKPNLLSDEIEIKIRGVLNERSISKES